MNMFVGCSEKADNKNEIPSRNEYSELYLIDFKFLIESEGKITYEDSSGYKFTELKYIGRLNFGEDSIYHCITQSLVTIPYTKRTQYKLWICTESKTIGVYRFDSFEDLPIGTDNERGIIFSDESETRIWRMDYNPPKYIYGTKDFGSFQEIEYSF